MRVSSNQAYKLKKGIVLSHYGLHDRTDDKRSARDEWCKIAVPELGKLSKLFSWKAQKSEGILSKSKFTGKTMSVSGARSYFRMRKI